MLLYKLGKKSGHFGLRKAIVKNLIFGVKMSIKRFRLIFAYSSKGKSMVFHRVFYDLENERKK